MIRLVSLALYPQRNNIKSPLNKRLVGPQVQDERFGEEKNLVIQYYL